MSVWLATQNSEHGDKFDVPEQLCSLGILMKKPAKFDGFGHCPYSLQQHLAFNTASRKRNLDIIGQNPSVSEHCSGRTSG
jgi:hypothetical protein